MHQGIDVSEEVLSGSRNETKSPALGVFWDIHCLFLDDTSTRVALEVILLTHPLVALCDYDISVWLDRWSRSTSVKSYEEVVNVAL